MNHVQKTQNPLELPPSERPGYREDDEAAEKASGPVNMEPAQAEIDLLERQQVGVRLNGLLEAEDILLSTSDPEQLAGAVMTLTGQPLGADEATRLLAASSVKRLGILFLLPEPNPEDEAYLKAHPELPRPAFKRQKATRERLDPTDHPDRYEHGDDGTVRLSTGERREAKARMGYLHGAREKLKSGGFGTLELKDQKRIDGMLSEALQVEEYLVAVDEHPEALQEVYALLSQGGLSEQELIGQMVATEIKYALGPKDKQDKAAQVAVEVSHGEEEKEAREAQMMETLGLDASEVQVVGRNAAGDIILKMDGGSTLCTVRPIVGGTFSVNAVKVTILGKVFIQGNPRKVSNGREFSTMVGAARLQAACARYRLPFDGPEQERMIEIFASEAAGISAFTYDQYQSLEPTFLTCLQGLTPRREEDQTRAFFKELGIIDGNGRLIQSQWQAVARDWRTLHHTSTPQEIVATLRQRYGTAPSPKA